jgi:hypothetical protein
LQASWVIRRRAFFHASQHLALALGETIHVVHEIDEQEFRTQRPRKGGLYAEVKRSPAEREQPVPFVIVNDGLVVKLGRTDPKAVVGVGRGEKEPVIPQERSDQLAILRAGSVTSGT